MAIQKTDINPKTGKAYAINPATGVWDDNYFANVVEKQFAPQQPTPSITPQSVSLSTPDTALPQQATNMANLLAKQKAEQGAFLGRYTTGMEAARNALSTELGLPQLRQETLTAGQTARDVSRTMQDLPTALTATGRAASVSQPRLTRAIAQRTTEMQPALETARRTAEDTATRQQFGETEYTRRLQEKAQPFQLEANMISEGLAREMTGFTQQNQNELTVILQKLQNNQALTMAEVNRANALANSEAEFERQKELAKIKQMSPVTLSAGDTVYDPITGRAKYTAPYKPEAGPNVTDPYKKYGISNFENNQNNPSNNDWSIIPDWATKSATAYNQWLSTQ